MPNTVITFLSAVYDDPKNPKKEQNYASDSPVQITGKYTNDAPAKYFLHKSEGINRILCIVTPEAENSFDIFSDMIEAECKIHSMTIPEIKKIKYVDSAEGINAAIDEITEYTDTNDCVYLDITGGFRHANYMVMLMVKFADFTNKKVSVAQVIYSSLYPARIIDITDIYKLFDLMNGAQNFMQFGNSDQLAEYFRGNNNTDSRIGNLIVCMQDFTEAVTLCKIKKLDIILEKLNNALDQMSYVDNTNDKGTMFFRKIVDVIKERFAVSKNDTICYPDVIRWCIYNNMIQQALTIYVEKMPKYMINEETGVIKASESERKRARENKRVYDEDYILFFEGFMLNTDVDDNFINTVSNFIKNNTELIAECSSAGEFLDRYKENDMPNHFPDLLDSIYSEKKNTYQEGGGRYTDEEIAEHYKDDPDLFRVFSKMSKPGSFKKFIKTIPTQKEILKIIHSRYLISEYAHNEAEPNVNKRQKHSLLKKVYTAENLETILSVSDKYKLTGISTENMSKFMLDYIYVKQYLRNQINHAADETSVGSEVTDILAGFGYCIENDETEIRISYIRGLVLKSLDLLN